MTSFAENGFLIVKNSISKKVSLEIQKSVLKTLYNKNVSSNNKNNYKLFSDKVKKYFDKKKLINTFKFVEPFYYQFVSDNIFKKVLESKKLLKVLHDLLGKDLSYIDDIAITLNLPDKSSSELNYLFKKWHQELWSGASVSNLLIWTPIFQHDNSPNQLEIIKQSHLWGHVPHRDREPISLPKNYKSFFTRLNVGDVLIFHPLLLHRSAPIKKDIKHYTPRLAFPIGVKNFRFVDHNTFSSNKSWKVFSKSELTLIENKLGNFYLSPFRLLRKDS